MENKNIYVVTTIEKIEDKRGLLITGSSRAVGFYYKVEDAIECVLNNNGDIFEYLYEYAIIEEYEEGLYPIAKEIKWFKWNNELKGYKEIEKPEETKHFCNYALG